MDHGHPGVHLIVGAHLLWGLALVGCRPDPQPDAPPARGHYSEWERLVDAAAEGDVATARVVARDLTDDGLADDDGTATIGGALGFLQLASDPGDLADGVASAARGCGECHQARRVPTPELPSWAHHSAVERAAAALVWSDATPPPPSQDPAGAALAAAWTDDREAGVTAVLRSCQSCHSGQNRSPAPQP